MSSFLESEAVPPDSMDMWELHGFLTALASAPSAIMPSTWLPALYGDDDGFANGTAAQATNALAVKLLNQISDALQSGDAFEPLGFPGRENAPRWAQGYVAGARLDGRWRCDDMGAALLFPLGVLAGMFDLTGEESEENVPIEDPTEHEAAYYDRLGQVAIAAHRYWRRQRVAFTGPKRRKDPARNLCLCGSGVSFDRCCGRLRLS